MRTFLISLVLCCWTVAVAADKVPETIAVGSVAPDFSLPGVDGKTYSLESFASADVVVLIFTCNHCPDAIAARGRIQEFAKTYADKKVTTVAISGNDPEALLLWELGWSVYGDSFDEMKALHAEEGWSFPYLYDGEHQAASLVYGALATPHVFVLDKARKVRYTGQFDNGRHGKPTKFPTKDAVDAILAGRDVEVTKTRAYGCSTKWSWKRESAKKNNEDWSRREVGLGDIDVELAKTIRKNEAKTFKLINIWSTTCGPCVVEFPYFVDAARRYERRGLEFVSVSLDNPADRSAAHAFLKKQQAATPHKILERIKAEGRTVTNTIFTGSDLDAFADAIDSGWEGPLPHSFLIAPDGEVVWRHTGSLDGVALRREIVNVIRNR